MKRINILIIMYMIFLLQFASALTGESDSYSVSNFGSGLGSSEASSDNLEANTLLLSESGTRSAESSQFTTNVGFFPNTTYQTTVSISSYSISPSSATVGSTIGLYISALNFDTVWAKITSPNSQEQTLNLINGQTINYVPSPSVVGNYQVIFYANSTSGSIASVVSSFALTEASSSSSSSSSGSGGGGGGGTTTIIEKCTYNWDCTPWSVCSDGKQTRECKNIGTCSGTESKPIEEMSCSEALFDIALKLENIELTKNKTLKFSIDLTEKIGVEKIDAHIKYSIINKEGYEIFSQIETKAIQENLSYQKDIEEIKLVDGEYILRVDIIYGNLQRAFAEQSFKVKGGELETISKFNIADFIKGVNYSTISLILLSILFSGMGFLFIFRKGSRRYLKFGFIPLLGIVILILTFKTQDLTGRAAFDILSSSKKILLIPFLIILSIVLFILFLNKLTIAYEKIANLFSKKKHPKNSIKGLVNRKVYSENGHYIGKVDDVILGENGIEKLKVKIGKKHKSKFHGLLIPYNHVKSAGEIVIVDDDIHHAFSQ